MVGNPFLKAMEISKGTVSILDKECEVYSRIWCIYELYKSLMDKEADYKFDVYTEHDWEYNHERIDFPKDSGTAIGLIDGFIDADNQYGIPNPTFKQLRESQFPLERILKASAIDIKKAVASEARDEKYIKNTIINQNEVDDPPEHHENYEKLNNVIRGFFVSSNLQRIVRDRSIEFDRKLIYFDILKKSRATVVYLNMYGFSQFNDPLAIQIAGNLPSTIKTFTIISDGSSVTQHGIQTIFKSLANLTNLEMLVLQKNNINDENCLVLADIIRNNQNIKEVDLRDNKIGYKGVKAISNALKYNNSVKILVLNNNQISVDGAIILADALGLKKSLKILGLLNNKIGDEGAKAIANIMKFSSSLEDLELGRNGITDEGGKILAAALKLNKSLTKLGLDMNNLSVEGAKEIAESAGACTGLAYLSLRGCHLSYSVCKDISAFLREKGVQFKYGLSFYDKEQ